MSYQKFAHDAGIIGVTQVFVTLGSFLLLPIITKTLGPYDYGIWAQISVTISLLSPIASMSLQMALVRFLSAEKDLVKIREGFYSIFFFIFFISFMITILVYFLSDFLAESIFQDITTAYLIKVGSFLILLTTIDQIVVFYFRTFQQIKTYSILLLINNVVRLFLILYLLWAGWGILGVIIASLLIQIFVIIIALIKIRNQIGFSIPQFTFIKEYLIFGAPLTPNSIIRWVTNSSDRYIVGYFLNLGAVGIYSASYAIGSLITFFTTPLQIILFPELSRLYEEKKIDEVKNRLRYSMKYFLLLAIPAVFGLSVLSKPILQILTTPEFESGAVIIPFIALSALLAGIFQIVINITLLTKQTHYNFLIQLSAAVSNILLNIALIPVFGILGAAFSNLISFSLMVGISIFICNKFLRFDFEVVIILKSIFASIIMSCIVFVINPVNISGLIIAICAGIITYFIIILLTKCLNRSELWMFKELISTK